MTLDRDAGALGAQIQDQVRAAVREGRLRADERLPSTRRLAADLGVSRGTVVDAYEQLIAEGYLRSTVGSGTTAASGPGEAAASRSAPSIAPAPAVADFEYGIPDLRSVPLADWRWALVEAIRRLRVADLGDGDPAGSMHLREVVAAYHRRVRAGAAVAADTVVVAGFREGLSLAFAALKRHGIADVALEDPGPYEHEALVRRAGLAAVPVPVDADGIDVAVLSRSGARAVLLTPAHQCPTGVVLTPSRRRRLIEWAEQVNGVVLEDDYDAEFRYDRQPVGSLQGLAPGRVIALGSVSKTLAPALRLGWVLAPRRFVADIADEKRLRSRAAPAVDQEALALLIETGRYDRHLRRMRDVYRRRRDALVDEVERIFGPGGLQGSVAGCHTLLRLPAGASEQEVVTEAAAGGVRVHGLARYRFPAQADADRPSAPALVIGFGNVDEERIRRGIQVIAAVVRRAGRADGR